MAWDAAYQTVGLVIPAQELTNSLSDDELSHSLAQLRAQGVIALSVELSDFPDWKLTKSDLSDDLVTMLHAARNVGLGVAFIVDAEQSTMPLLSLRPDFVIVIAEHGEGVPSWVMTDFRDATVGIVEFSEPSGLMRLYQSGWRDFVRVHAIKSRELDRLGIEGALTRWERAVQERTIRLLWVTEHQRFFQYLERLSQRLAQLGMKLGRPSAPAPFESSYLIYLAIGAGLVSLVVLAFMSFQESYVLLYGGLGGVIALAILGARDFDLARQALALTIAILAPWLLLFLCREKLSGWRLLVVVSFGSSCAGLAIAALLSDLPYFLKIVEFRGVKLALVAPSVLIIFTELWRWRESWGTLTAQLRRGAWLVPAIGLGALFFVLERSGNLPAIPVARWEELLRERLEDWLIARPRFKEFFVGHPALMLWNKGNSSLVQIGLVALGALGQASIINTFVHLHTPIALSLWRTLNGLVLGLLIGVFVRSILLGVRRWRQRS